MVAAKDPLEPNGKRSDQIKSEVAATRARMDETIDEVADCLRPRHLLNNAMSYVRSHRPTGDQTTRAVRKAGSKILREIKEHPLPAILIGAGVVWLLLEEESEEPAEYGEPRSSYASSRIGRGAELPYDETIGPDVERGADTVDRAAAMAAPSLAEGSGKVSQIKDRVVSAVSEAKDKVAGAIGSTAESVGESVKSAAESVKSAAQQAGDGLGKGAGKVRETAASVGTHIQDAGAAVGHKARETASLVTDKARQTASTVRHQVRRGYDYTRTGVEDLMREHPLAVGLGVLAAGLLVGLALPRTRREDELIGERSDELKRRAARTGEELVDRGAKVAEAAVGSAAQAAEAAVGHVAEEAERQGLTASALVEKVGGEQSEEQASGSEDDMNRDESRRSQTRHSSQSEQRGGFQRKEETRDEAEQYSGSASCPS